MSDIRAPRPVLSTPDSTPDTADTIAIELPEIEEPETVAPLVLAIAEELIDESDSSTPKKAKLHPSTKVTMKTVEIKISMPAVPIPNLKPITEHRAYVAAKIQAAKLPRKKLALSGIVLAIILFTVGSNLLSDHNARVAANKRSGQQTLTKGTPDYPTVLPAGKTIQELGGWTLVSPPGRDPAFAYIDSIGNTQINVSQQPLPDSLKPDTDKKVEMLAKEYGASEKLTAGNTSFYIGSSEKGPQSIILSKNDLLILIKSAVKIDNAKWTEYIGSLQ
jgi:hypothetical protein